MSNKEVKEIGLNWSNYAGCVSAIRKTTAFANFP